MRLDLSAVTLHYEAFGEGRALVFLPGWPDDWRAPAGYMEPLFADRQGWQRFYLDLPGRGETPGPESISSNDQVLDVILEFIDRVVSARRFTIAGQSYGGYLARAVLKRRVGQVDALLNVVPVIDPEAPDERLPERVAFVEDPALIARIEGELGPEMAQVFAEFGGWLQTAPVYERMKKEVVPGLGMADREFLAPLAANQELAMEVDRLPAAFEGPALFVLGRQDAGTGYADAWELLDNYPRGTFAVLDRASHALAWEQVSVFNALVSEWLDRIEGQAPPR